MSQKSSNSKLLMLVYTTKMRNMSIEEWIKEREQRGHMTFYVSEIPQFPPPSKHLRW